MTHEPHAHSSDAYEQFWAAVDTPPPAPPPAAKNPEPPVPPDAYEQFSSASEN